MSGLHGVDIKEGLLLSGDNTVMAICRNKNNSLNNFIINEINEKQLFVENSVIHWLPNEINSKLNELGKTLTEKTSNLSLIREEDGTSSTSAKKGRTVGGTRKKK
jgi:hypothetical protein